MRGFFWVIVIGILFLPSIALTHPGKTDRRGGHACRKDCSEWELYVGEYHLHEEDFRPVRTEGKSRPKTMPTPEDNTGTIDVKARESAPVAVNNLTDTIVEEKKAAVPISQHVSDRTTTAQMIPEPNSFSRDQLWLLLTALGLIFLLAALIAKRKKTGG